MLTFRCTAVEHAVKLIVEGQVASMATSRDKRADRAAMRPALLTPSTWHAGLDGHAERSVQTLLTQKRETCLWICSLNAGPQVGASDRGKKRWSGYPTAKTTMATTGSHMPGYRAFLASRACSLAARP